MQQLFNVVISYSANGNSCKRHPAHAAAVNETHYDSRYSDCVICPLVRISLISKPSDITTADVKKLITDVCSRQLNTS